MVIEKNPGPIHNIPRRRKSTTKKLLKSVEKPYEIIPFQLLNIPVDS